MPPLRKTHLKHPYISRSSASIVHEFPKRLRELSKNVTPPAGCK